MSTQYQYAEIDEVFIDSPDNEPIMRERSVSDIYFSRLQPDQGQWFTTPRKKKWPKTVGIVQIVSGFITAMLGTLEVFIIPLFENLSDEHPIVIGKRNCYAAGLWAGLTMVVTGSTAVRASISKRNSTIQRYIIQTVISVIIYMALTVLLIFGFTHGWTVRDKFPSGSSLWEIHVFLTASMVLGLLFVLTAFIQYYDVVFFGEIQLCRKWLMCCCYCLCPKPGQDDDVTPVLQRD